VLPPFLADFYELIVTLVLFGLTTDLWHKKRRQEKFLTFCIRSYFYGLRISLLLFGVTTEFNIFYIIINTILYSKFDSINYYLNSI